MKEVDEETRRKWFRRAAIAGFVLALVCHSLPPHYRAVCEFISNACKGG